VELFFAQNRICGLWKYIRSVTAHGVQFQVAHCGEQRQCYARRWVRRLSFTLLRSNLILGFGTTSDCSGKNAYITWLKSLSKLASKLAGFVYSERH
jgi:hypothetical protein